MARSWSNRRIMDERSAAQKQKGRPTSLNLYVILLVVASVFFAAIIVGTAVQTLRRPPVEVTQPASHDQKLKEPKED